MSSHFSDNKFFKPNDFIKSQMTNEVNKKNIVNKNSDSCLNVGLENNGIKNDSILFNKESDTVNASENETIDLHDVLTTVLKQSRDRKFIDNKILELDYYKKLSFSVMKSDCKDSSVMARNFIKTLDQTKILLENLWKFHA